ncbi:MAG: guanylate kinase, partial [Eubacterium sp.]|nr:guanylate kinase [Eubacterium sp.]
ALVPVYVALDDGERLARAVKRERLQREPNYKEVCRRYLADEEDFSDIELERAGIEKFFYNMDLDTAVSNIEEYLSDVL